jgi:hypothetical protein
MNPIDIDPPGKRRTCKKNIATISINTSAIRVFNLLHISGLAVTKPFSDLPSLPRESLSQFELYGCGVEPNTLKTDRFRKKNLQGRNWDLFLTP